MTNRCKLLGLLTLQQAELLKTLFELGEQTDPARYWKPKDLGGYRSSHHTLTLRKLLALGFAEKNEQGSGSFSYRITAAGQATWELFRLSSQLPLASLVGGASVHNSARNIMRLAA
jgi:hypothetical protein